MASNKKKSKETEITAPESIYVNRELSWRSSTGCASAF